MKQADTEALKKVKAFAFDCDGVLTDGSIIIHPDGHQMRNMFIKDGYALQLAAKQGFHIAIITGGSYEPIRTRFNGLGINDVFTKVSDKVDKLEEFMAGYGLGYEDILYMGDDLPDWEVMGKVGFPTCPADAADEMKAISKYVSRNNGGKGCVRDVLEQCMRAQGKWFDPSNSNVEDFRW